MDLKDLGNRICIIGSSSTGKSTLALALSQHLGVPLVHLDQWAHVPGTAWVPRGRDEWAEKHREFLDRQTEWVIEGNYSFLMPERFLKATGIIYLDFPMWGSLLRYFKRTRSARRVGDLEGAPSAFTWSHLHHMLLVAPKNRQKYLHLLGQSGLPVVHVRRFADLMALYRTWGLTLAERFQ